jgi:AraC-like DNA-binding protein
MAKAATIEARVARYVIDDLQRRQLPVDGLLREVGLRRSDLSDSEARLPYASVIRLIEGAATLTGDNSFGLRLGASRDTRERGLLGFLVLNSATLMDALVNLQRYSKVAAESEEVEIERLGAHVALRFRETDPSLRGLRHNSDYVAATVVRACRDLTRKHVSPLRAEFICAQPNSKVAHRDILGCPVKFQADWDALIFAQEAAHLPVIGADDELLKVLESACRRILGPKAAKQDMVQQVRELIVDRLPKGTANMEVVASTLAMSVKTLERRLAEHGRTFSELVDSLRCQTAKHYLEETDLRVSQIAYLAGYTEPAALVRAFKRWTGKTPLQYREAHN